MKAHTTDDFHQSLETGDLCAFVCVLIAVHPVTNYNKLMRANSGFSQIFKHSISQPVPCKAIETHRPRQLEAHWDNCRYFYLCNSVWSSIVGTWRMQHFYVKLDSKWQMKTCSQVLARFMREPHSLSRICQAAIVSCPKSLPLHLNI